MKRTVMVLAALLVLPTLAVGADRTLDKSEVQALFDQLTSRPQRTWISAGTIRATHTEYRASRTTDSTAVEARVKQAVEDYQNNPDKPQRTGDLQKMTLDAIPFNVRYEWSNEHTMTTTEVIRYDGDRFYWEIQVGSRTDSIQPDKDLAYNDMIEAFNLDWNGTRVFAWDGQTYTSYSLPVNQALVQAGGQTPHKIHGALTAGIIPWGYGLLTAEGLRSAAATAVETRGEGQTHVHLSLQWPGGTQFEFVLDRQKDLAALSACAVGPGCEVVTTTFESHKWVAGRWVPTGISIERRDRQADRLLAYDLWDMESIDVSTPSAAAFIPEYQPRAVIRYETGVSGTQTLLYEYTNLVGTGSLLAGRLEAAQAARPVNCATVSLGYVARELGRPVAGTEWARAVDSSGNTSLYTLRQLAQDRGLCSRAVKTDLDTLRGLDGCRAILHLPGQSHFVVLARVDGARVWLADLTRSRFLYQVDTEAFAHGEWAAGVALLVSRRPMGASPHLIDIPDAEQRTLVGATGYACTEHCQHGYIVDCDQVNYVCVGNTYWFWDLYCCQEAQSGVCTNLYLERARKSPCMNDPYDPYNCTDTGEWTLYYTRGACGYSSS